MTDGYWVPDSRVPPVGAECIVVRCDNLPTHLHEPVLPWLASAGVTIKGWAWKCEEHASWECDEYA